MFLFVFSFFRRKPVQLLRAIETLLESASWNCVTEEQVYRWIVKFRECKMRVSLKSFQLASDLVMVLGGWTFR